LIDISRPPVDLHQFRQTQTLSTIYNYFISGIDFLKPELDTNGSHSVIILEFPLYQALVAFFMKVFGYHEEIARLLNVFMIVCGGVALAKLSEQYIQKGTFSVVLIFFLFNPSILFWSSTTIIDPFVLGATLVSAYLLFRWYQSPEDKGKFYTAM
ncbi:ArnT family glycosyltransferase, partial [Vibrio lentus]